jgi:hypothetical protein
MTPDMILAAVLVVMFVIGLMYLFFTNLPMEDIQEIAIFVGHYFVIAGIPLALAFVVGHFIIKYW